MSEKTVPFAELVDPNAYDEERRRVWIESRKAMFAGRESFELVPVEGMMLGDYDEVARIYGYRLESGTSELAPELGTPIRFVGNDEED